MTGYPPSLYRASRHTLIFSEELACFRVHLDIRAGLYTQTSTGYVPDDFYFPYNRQVIRYQPVTAVSNMSMTTHA